MVRISRKTVLTYSLCTLGALFVLLALIGIFSTGINAGTAITFSVAAALLLFAFFYEKLPLVVRIVFYSLLALGLAFASFLPIYGSIETVDHQEDAVIVLGAGLRGEDPSKALRFRLDAAYDYAMQNPNAIIIVSGGQGENEVIAESTAMKRYLVKKGLSEERIIEEDRSTNTKENLAFSKAILDEKFEKEYRIAIVSNDYHVLRAESLAKEAGFTSITHKAAKTPASIFVPCTLRECLAVIYYFIF